MSSPRRPIKWKVRTPSPRLRVHLLGVGLSGLGKGKLEQQELFADDDHDRQSRLDEVADSIQRKVGASSLQRALGMLHKIDPHAGSESPRDDQYGE